MPRWIGALVLALALLVAWGRLRLRFGFRLPEGGPAAVTLSALGVTFRRELGLKTVREVAGALFDPGRVAAGLSEIPVGEWLGLLRANLDLLRWMLPGIRVTGVSLDARLGTGDAAGTGLLLGLCWAGAGLVTPWAGVRPRLRLRPEYGRAVLDVDFRTAVEIGLARLILFNLRLAWRLAPYLLRRIARPGRSNISQESGQEGVAP